MVAEFPSPEGIAVLTEAPHPDGIAVNTETPHPVEIAVFTEAEGIAVLAHRPQAIGTPARVVHHPLALWPAPAT